MPKKPLVHTIAERQGTRGLSLIKASRGTTLVQLEASSVEATSRTWSAITGANRTLLIAFALGSAGVQNACSEGRNRKACCRLAPKGGSLKTSDFGQCPRQCSCETILLCRELYPVDFRVSRFFRDIAEKGEHKQKGRTQGSPLLLPCYFLSSIFAAGTVSVVPFNFVPSTAEFIIFLPICELTTAVVTWEMNAVRTSKSG